MDEDVPMEVERGRRGRDGRPPVDTGKGRTGRKGASKSASASGVKVKKEADGMEVS